MTAISKEVTRRETIGRGINGLLPTIWDWYISKSTLVEVGGELARSLERKLTFSRKKTNGGISKKKQHLETLISEPGLKAFIRAYLKH